MQLASPKSFPIFWARPLRSPLTVKPVVKTMPSERTGSAACG